MRARLPWILLAVSMVLNFAVVGGVLYAWHGGGRFGGGPERAVDRLSEQLTLNGEQEARLREVISSAIARRQAHRESPPPQRVALIEQLAAGSFNEEEVRRLLGEMSADRNVHWLEVTRDMHGFVATLDAEQKSEFVRMAKDRAFFRKLFRPHRPRRD